MVNFNNYQREAIYSENNCIIVIAAPGSGKTTVLVHRIYNLINNKLINPKEIVVITFTKKAALNMEDRFLKLSNLNEPPFFGTFHSFCYRILLNEGYNIKIISESEKYKLIKGFVYELTGKALNSSRHINKEVYKLDKVMEKYNKHKKENKLFDFDDLEDEVIGILEEDEKRKKYNKKYKHILVDEFQDCNDKQIHILKRFNECSIFAVGDEDQCIYTFRGSNPEYMVTFSEHFKEGIKLQLPINYRCPKNIVLMSKNLIKYNKMRNHKDINYFKQSDGIVNILDHENEEFAYKVIMENIEKLHENISCGVLVRTNKEIIPILYNLFKKNIAVCVKDDFSFLDFKVMKDLENLFKLSINFNDLEAFISLTPYLSKIEKESLKNASDLFKHSRSFSLHKRRRILILKIITLFLNIFNKIYIVKVLKHLPYYSKIINFKEIENILLNFNLYNYSLNDIIKHLKYLKDSLYNKNSRITISTIHGIKGMEFDEVHILNACEDFLPINTNEANIEEERRIFYIAITRARENLTIHTIKNYMKNKREKSRFLKELFE